jgi:glycosyltransferase involved in cell wall biosynthesis
VIANSRATLATIPRAAEAVVIPYVLPPPPGNGSLARRRGSDGDAPLRFGVVGRLAPWKGQDLFLRAFAEAFPDGDERAVIIGDALFGEGEFAARLPALAQGLGIAGRVELRGHRPNVWEELDRLDVLVHSSLIPEPLGQVVLEGMAAGVPVIAAGAGGPAEILRHDVTGVLYQPAQMDELAAAMQRLRDPHLRDRLREAARHDLSPFSADNVAGQIQALYEQVLARR